MSMRILLTGVIIITAVFMVLFVILQPNTSNENLGLNTLKLTNFVDVNQGLSLNYPQTLKKLELTKNDIKDNFIFRADNVNGSDEPVLVSVRYEKGLKEAAALTKQNKLEMVIQNLRKSYPTRFPGFNEISSKITEIEGHEAKEVIFSYQTQKITSYQRLVIIDKNDDSVIYIAMQSTKSGFYSVNKNIFDLIINSAKIN